MAEIHGNAHTYNLFNPTREQFPHLSQQADFIGAATRTKPGEQWIVVVAAHHGA